MSANGTNEVEIARLQERSERNHSELQEVKTWVDELSDDVKDVKDVQNQQLIVLQKMESSLDHMNTKLSEHDSHDIRLERSISALQLAHTKTATKFKLVMGILAVIGTAVLGVATKILFFSPILSGG